MGSHGHDFDSHIRACISVFVTLLILTFITVLVSYLKVPMMAGIVIALTIASVKAALVLAYFMHLVSEKYLIYFSLTLTFIFFVGLLFIPVISDMDVIQHIEQRIY